jgi:hypothetical protein
MHMPVAAAGGGAQYQPAGADAKCTGLPEPLPVALAVPEELEARRRAAFDAGDRRCQLRLQCTSSSNKMFKFKLTWLGYAGTGSGTHSGKAARPGLLAGVVVLPAQAECIV